MIKNLKFIPFNLFPTLVVKVPGFLNKDQIKDALELVNTYPDEDRKVMDGSINVGDKKMAISSFSPETERDILQELTNTVSSCNHLLSDIQQCLNEYTAAHRMKSLLVTNSWFNIMDVGSILAYHIHEYSIVSGALYLQKKSGCSDITFKTPNPYAKMFSTHSNLDTPGCTRSSVTTEAGDLLIFPSWLEHGTDYYSPLNDKRVVLSFNSNFNLHRI